MSDSMWPASESSASDPEMTAVMISVIMKAARSVSAATRYRESASEGREDHACDCSTFCPRCVVIAADVVIVGFATVLNIGHAA
jgi:hypothetical protein